MGGLGVGSVVVMWEPACAALRASVYRVLVAVGWSALATGCSRLRCAGLWALQGIWRANEEGVADDKIRAVLRRGRVMMWPSGWC